MEFLEKGRHSAKVKNPRMKLYFSISQLLTYTPLLVYYLALWQTLEARQSENNPDETASVTGPADLKLRRQLQVELEPQTALTQKWLDKQKFYVWTCIVQLLISCTIQSILCLLTLRLRSQSFIIVHLTPALQLIALFGIIPVYAFSLVVDLRFGQEISIQFFLALVVTMNLFLTKPYQLLAKLAIVAFYLLVIVSLLSNFQRIPETENVQNESALTTVNKKIEDEMAAHITRYVQDSSLCIQVLVYICALWLIASTGQPSEPITNIELKNKEDMHRSFADVVNILELETQPYVIMQHAKTYNCPPKVSIADQSDQESFEFDLDFFVKFISRSFYLEFLRDFLQVNHQSVVDFDQEKPKNTQPFDMEQLDIEELLFKRVTKKSLAEFTEKWVSSDDESSYGKEGCSKQDDDSSMEGSSSSGDEDKKYKNQGMQGSKDTNLLTLKQIIDSWIDGVEQNEDGEDPDGRSRQNTSKVRELSIEDNIFEIKSREIFRREQLFQGYSNLSQRDVQNNRVFESLLESARSQESQSSLGQLYEESKRDSQPNQEEALAYEQRLQKRRSILSSIGIHSNQDHQDATANKSQSFQPMSQIESSSNIGHKLDRFRKEILSKRRKHMDLEDKVFVYITVHELVQNSKLIRIVKFHRISKLKQLRRLVAQTKIKELDAGILMKSARQKDSDHLSVQHDPKRSASSCLFDKERSSSELCVSFKWLREYMEQHNSNQIYLKYLLENMLFCQKDAIAKSFQNNSSSPKYEKTTVRQRSIVASQSELMSQFIPSLPIDQPSSKNESASIATSQKYSRQQTLGEHNQQKTMLQMINDAMSMFEGFQIESLTHRALCQIFSQQKMEFFATLQYSRQNPVSIVTQAIRYLKRILSERNIMIKVCSSKAFEVDKQEQITDYMVYDWEIYACIIYNQLLSVIQDKKIRIIIIELSFQDTSRDLEQEQEREPTLTEIFQYKIDNHGQGDSITNPLSFSQRQKNLSKSQHQEEEMKLSQIVPGEQNFLITKIFTQIEQQKIEVEPLKEFNSDKAATANKKRKKEKSTKEQNYPSRAAQLLAKSINGSIQQINMGGGLDTFVCMLPTQVQPQDKIQVKVNLLKCFERQQCEIRVRNLPVMINQEKQDLLKFARQSLRDHTKNSNSTKSFMVHQCTKNNSKTELKFESFISDKVISIPSSINTDEYTSGESDKVQQVRVSGHSCHVSAANSKEIVDPLTIVEESVLSSSQSGNSNSPNCEAKLQQENQLKERAASTSSKFQTFSQNMHSSAHGSIQDSIDNHMRQQQSKKEQVEDDQVDYQECLGQDKEIIGDDSNNNDIYNPQWKSKSQNNVLESSEQIQLEQSSNGFNKILSSSILSSQNVYSDHSSHLSRKSSLAQALKDANESLQRNQSKELLLYSRSSQQLKESSESELLQKHSSASKRSKDHKKKRSLISQSGRGIIHSKHVNYMNQTSIERKRIMEVLKKKYDLPKVRQALPKSEKQAFITKKNQHSPRSENGSIKQVIIQEQTLEETNNEISFPSSESFPRGISNIQDGSANSEENKRPVMRDDQEKDSMTQNRSASSKNENNSKELHVLTSSKPVAKQDQASGPSPSAQQARINLPLKEKKDTSQKQQIMQRSISETIKGSGNEVPKSNINLKNYKGQIGVSSSSSQSSQKRSPLSRNSFLISINKKKQMKKRQDSSSSHSESPGSSNGDLSSSSCSASLSNHEGEEDGNDKIGSNSDHLINIQLQGSRKQHSKQHQQIAAKSQQQLSGGLRRQSSQQQQLKSFDDNNKSILSSKSNQQASMVDVQKKTCQCTATVLIIEDNYYNVLPLKMMLRTTYGISTDRAENGKLGFEAYQQNSTKTCCRTYYKVIFMDLQMPVMDGYQSCSKILDAYNRLSTQPAYSHLVKPVIFAMTAFQNPDTVTRCVKVGMNGIFNKPVNKKGLITQINKFFAQGES